MLPVTARVFRHAFVRGSVVPRVRMAPAWATQVACNSTARGVPPQHAAGGTGAGKPPAGQPQRPMGIVDANGNILRSKPAAPASKPGIPSAPATKEVIIEVDASNFQAVVLQSPVAVILDCYADWCEPCKQLTPKLEAIVRSAKGLVRLAKLNVDTSPGISAQLGVRSLPSVLGIVAGRMVDSFTGLIPDEGLKQFFTKVITAAEQAGMTHPDGNPLDKVVAGITECSTMVDEGAFSEATTKISSLIETLQQYYTQVYEGLRAEADRAATQASQTPLPVRTDTGPLADLDNLTARAISVLIRALLASAQATVSSTTPSAEPAVPPSELFAQARQFAENLRTRYKAFLKDPEVVRGLAAYDLAAGAEKSLHLLVPLLKEVQADPSNPDKLLALAEAQVAAGQFEPAINNLLALLKISGPAWKDGIARVTLVKIFDTLGPSHPLVGPGRKALSKALFR